MADNQWVEAGDESSVPEGGAVSVQAHGHRVALFRSGGRLYALGARCTHAGGPLDEGTLKDGNVVCPWHNSRFDLATGEVRGGPAPAPVPVFPVKVEGGKVYLGEPPAGTEPPPPTMF